MKRDVPNPRLGDDFPWMVHPRFVADYLPACSGDEFKVLFWVYLESLASRQTVAAFTLEELAERTGMTSDQVTDALRGLIERHMLVVDAQQTPYLTMHLRQDWKPEVSP